MRGIFLIIFLIAAAIYFFLVAAVNDDIKWFHNFSKSSNQKLLKPFQAFDFTYNDVFSTCFSIKFLQSDTALIRQHFTSSSDNLKIGTSYYTLLSKEDKKIIDSFISTIPFQTYDTSYYEYYQDGIDYQFYIEKETIQKRIRIHSNSVPSALADFKDWIVKRKQQYQLHQFDTTIYFESAKYVVPPPRPVSPTMEFKIPKIETSR
ncbi:MAG: hypothetical protein QM668_00260 [Agriterribacter sp.]